MTLLAISVIAMGAAASADLHSSKDRYELNPLMRGPHAYGMKAAVVGGLPLAERKWMKQHPKWATAINFGAAAAWTSVAVRNYKLEK